MHRGRCRARSRFSQRKRNSVSGSRCSVLEMQAVHSETPRRCSGGFHAPSARSSLAGAMPNSRECLAQRHAVAVPGVVRIELQVRRQHGTQVIAEGHVHRRQVVERADRDAQQLAGRGGRFFRDHRAVERQAAVGAARLEPLAPDREESLGHRGDQDFAAFVRLLVFGVREPERRGLQRHRVTQGVATDERLLAPELLGELEEHVVLERVEVEVAAPDQVRRGRRCPRDRVPPTRST